MLPTTIPASSGAVIETGGDGDAEDTVEPVFADIVPLFVADEVPVEAGWVTSPRSSGR